MCAFEYFAKCCLHAIDGEKKIAEEENIKLEIGVVNKLTPADDSFTHFSMQYFCPLVSQLIVAIVV